MKVYWVLALVIFLFAMFLLETKPASIAKTARNGKTYRVLHREDAQAVADMLGVLEDTLEDFLREGWTATNDPRIRKIQKRWQRSRGGLTEVAPGSDIAYSINKGAIYVCLRNAQTGELESLNDCLYVLLHELAHVCTDEYGHPPRFWANFRFLLELAERTGHYTYADHQRSTYCGHPLGENVIQCVHERKCKSQI